VVVLDQEFAPKITFTMVIIMLIHWSFNCFVLVFATP